MKRFALVLVVAAACGGKAAAPAAVGVVSGDDTADAPAPPCTAADVVASWSARSGSDFEEITVEDGGAFTTYLHERPFASGRWTLVDGALVLTATDGTVDRIDDVHCQYTDLTGTREGAHVLWTAIQPGAM